nr:hypothetical protein [Desulfobacula sp.]
MAKIRVYELAKDLNMTNTALLNKMKELKIEVKSHMSSLEDSDISAIKRSLFGKEKGKNELKIKPSVIRRRRSPAEEISEREGDEEMIPPPREERIPDGELQNQEIEPPSPEKPQSAKTAEIEPKKDKPGIKKAQPARIIRPVVVEPPVSIKPAEPEKSLEPVSAQKQEPVESGEAREAAAGPGTEDMDIRPAHEEKSDLSNENLSEPLEENEMAVTDADPLNTEDRDEKAKRKKKKEKVHACKNRQNSRPHRA